MAYDQPDTETGCTNSYPTGRLTRMTDATGTTTYCYDHRGNVMKKVQVTNGATLTVAYTYNLADEVTAVTYPSGEVVSFTRNPVSQITAVDLQSQFPDSPRTIAQAITYRPFGPVAGFTLGNGAVHAVSFDLASRLTSYQWGTSTPYALSYDLEGNILTISNSSAHDQSFAYDALDRLTHAEGKYGVLDYSYDANGNRLQRIQTDAAGTETTDYSYPASSNRLVQAGSTAYGYDAAGNPVQIGNRTLTYNDLGRLVIVEVNNQWLTQYGYNALGQRVARDDANGALTLFLFDGAGHLIGEYDATGEPEREYIWLNDEPLAQMQPDAGATDIFYFHTDHRGAPFALRPQQGNVGATVWYLPFGGTYLASASFDQPIWTSDRAGLYLRYPGQWADADYNYFRDYEPETGRYIESDPIGLFGDINTYAYADLNPLIAVDFFGLRGIRPPPRVPRNRDLHEALENLPDPSITDCLGLIIPCPPRWGCVEWECDFSPDPALYCTAESANDDITFPGDPVMSGTGGFNPRTEPNCQCTRWKVR